MELNLGQLLLDYTKACEDKCDLFDFYNNTWHDLFDLAKELEELKENCDKFHGPDIAPARWQR